MYPMKLVTPVGGGGSGVIVLGIRRISVQEDRVAKARITHKPTRRIPRNRADGFESAVSKYLSQNMAYELRLVSVAS
jgi:hypothetical protein